MAVSKRLRFEIFRRDNHTCRYCGATTPDATLTVDHVLPVALGGKDEASNLVTACRDCNAGKSSSSPDAPLVDDASEDDIRWSKAVTRAAEVHREKDRRLDTFKDAVYDGWTETFAGMLSAVHEPDAGWYIPPNNEDTYPWVVYDYQESIEKPVKLCKTEEEAERWVDQQYQRVPFRPKDWDVSLHLWLAAGVDERDVESAMRKARDARHVSNYDKYRYFCGIIWRTIDDRQKIAKELIAADEGED